MQWLNFMIIMQVTKKVLIVFFSPKEILLDTNTFSVSTSSKNLEPYCGKKNFFQFQFTQKLLYPFSYVIMNFMLFNVSFHSVKTAFFIKFMASFLLTKQ